MKKHLSIFLFLLIIAGLFLSGCGCKQKTANYKANLEIWGLFDDSDTFSKVIDEYKKRNPNIGDVVYKKLVVNTYENDLRDALATGKGPDIFLIHNSWLPKHQDKLAPAPQNIVNLKQAQDSFPDVVAADFTRDQDVYALPLSVDSLALYVNKDYFNQAGISRAPQTWTEFDETVRRLTKTDAQGNIILSGAAMGMSSDSSSGDGKINRATDILTLLMLQSGTQMLDKATKLATFAEYTATLDNQQISPGQMALTYYTKFTDPKAKEYCWNSLMHNSVDSFVEGRTAMILNYSWQIQSIQNKAPKLNFGVSPVPQNIDQSGKGINVDFANYWGFAVSKNKVEGDTVAETGAQKSTATNEQRVAEAWKFLRYLTMNPSYSSGPDLKAPSGADSAKFDPAADYAIKQKKPAARRDLLGPQTNDPMLAPFAQGDLIARSWPQPDNLAVEKIFDSMIDDVVLRNVDVEKAINSAQNSVNLLVKK